MVNKVISKIKGIVGLDIVKVFSFTSISTLIKTVAGFISVKVIAVIIGSPGIALVGQLNNFSSIIMSIATGGITTGVTKYIAQYKDDANLTKSYISTAVKITLFFSIISGLSLVLGSSIFSEKILLDSKYSFVFIIFGITLIFYAFNNLLLAIINGYKQFGLYIKISIASSLVGLLLSLLLVIPFGVNGALLNAVTSQSFVFIIAFFLVRKTKIIFLSKEYLLSRFDKFKSIQLFRFALMTLVSSFCGPISQLIVRGYIIHNISIQAAGLWEGMNRLSNVYLMLITSSFGVYYLPKLSSISNHLGLKREINTAFKIIVPCLLFLLPCIFLGRSIIVKLLFSSEFDEMSKLFLWQLIGDFFKISSWLIAYLRAAKAMIKFSIFTEIFFSIFYVLCTIIFINITGLRGTVIAYSINYFLYFLAMYFFIYLRLEKIV